MAEGEDHFSFGREPGMGLGPRLMMTQSTLEKSSLRHLGSRLLFKLSQRFLVVHG